MILEGEVIVVLTKFLIGGIVLSILVIGVYIALKTKFVPASINENSAQIDPTKKNIIYVLWIGNTLTTMHVLDLVKNSASNEQQMVIQPIFIPDPEDLRNPEAKKVEYELQNTAQHSFTPNVAPPGMKVFWPPFCPFLSHLGYGWLKLPTKFCPLQRSTNTLRKACFC